MAEVGILLTTLGAEAGVGSPTSVGVLTTAVACGWVVGAASARAGILLAATVR